MPRKRSDWSSTVQAPTKNIAREIHERTRKRRRNFCPRITLISLMKNRFSLACIRVIRGQKFFPAFRVLSRIRGQNILSAFALSAGKSSFRLVRVLSCISRGDILSLSRHRRITLILAQRIDREACEPVLAFVIAVGDRRKRVIQMLISDRDEMAVLLRVLFCQPIQDPCAREV